MSVTVARGIVKNTTIQFGQQLATWGFSFLLMLFLPRYLGPEAFGRLYLAETVTGLFIVIIAFDGVFSIGKYVARDRSLAGEVITNSLAFRLIIWVCCMITLYVYTIVSDYTPEVKTLMMIFGVHMLWCGTRGVYRGTFLGFEDLKYNAIASIAERVFIAVVGIAALLLGAREVVIAIVMILGTLLNFLVMARAIKTIVPKLPPVDWKKAFFLAKQGFPYLLWTVFGIIYYRMNTVLLGELTSEKVVGWYGAANKFYDTLAFIPTMFTVSILPVLSRMRGQGDNMLALTTQKSVNFILLTGIPASILLYSFAADIIGFLYGLENYGPSVINLQMCAIGLVLLYIDMVLGTANIACDNQKKLAAVSFVAIFINVGLNLWLIPMTQTQTGNGGIGSGMATIITELFVLICSLALLPKDLLQRGTPWVVLKALGAGIVMTGFILATAGVRADLPGGVWMAMAAAAGLVYVGALFMFRTFSREELSFMRGLVRELRFGRTPTLRENEA